MLRIKSGFNLEMEDYSQRYNKVEEEPNYFMSSKLLLKRTESLGRSTSTENINQGHLKD